MNEFGLYILLSLRLSRMGRAKSSPISIGNIQIYLPVFCLVDVLRLSLSLASEAPYRRKVCLSTVGSFGIDCGEDFPPILIICLVYI